MTICLIVCGDKEKCKQTGTTILLPLVHFLSISVVLWVIRVDVIAGIRRISCFTVGQLLKFTPPHTLLVSNCWTLLLVTKRIAFLDAPHCLLALCLS